jgi:hypothetical protein
MMQPTKRHEYAIRLYEALEAEAHEMVHLGQRVKRWEGFILVEVDRLGIPRGEYARVMKYMKDNDLIVQWQRGARATPSVLLLVKPPPADPADLEKISAKRLTQPPTLARMAVSVEALQKQLGGIDLRQLLLEYDQRLTRVEALLREAGLGENGS